MSYAKMFDRAYRTTLCKYGDCMSCQSTHAWPSYICLIFSVFSNVYHSACVWPTALKLGCVTNLDPLFLEMGFISLVDDIQFMLISRRHICIRSMASLEMMHKLRVCEVTRGVTRSVTSKTHSRPLRGPETPPTTIRCPQSLAKITL